MNQRSTDRARSCTGKHRYVTSFAAFMAAQSASRRTGDRIEYYHCRFCRRYHIGHV